MTKTRTEHLSEQEKDDRYYEIEKKNLGWIYSEYEPEEPEPESQLSDEAQERQAELYLKTSFGLDVDLSEARKKMEEVENN